MEKKPTKAKVVRLEDARAQRAATRHEAKPTPPEPQRAGTRYQPRPAGMPPEAKRTQPVHVDKAPVKRKAAPPEMVTQPAPGRMRAEAPKPPEAAKRAGTSLPVDASDRTKVPRALDLPQKKETPKRPEAASTPSKKRRRRRRRSSAYWSIPVSLLMLVFLAIAWFWAQEEYSHYAQFQTMRQAVNRTTFYDGITVDGVDLGGMTLEAAQAQLTQRDQEKAQQFEVYVQSGDRKWRISSEDVPVGQNTDEILRKAYALGRTGDLATRYNMVQTLARDGTSFETAFTYDREAVRSLTDIVATRLYIDGYNAQVDTFDFATKAFTFLPEKAGQFVDPNKLYAQVIDALERKDYGTVLDVEITPIVPQMTQAELAASYGRLATFTTKTTTDKNRNTNITLSAEAVSNRVLKPGDIISYNESTGERTREKGYREAGAIKNGQVVDDTGGGVCQTSTTLFNALIRSGLDIVERRPHAWPATYVPRGEDAMVDWPNKDLKMQNNTGGNIYIVAYFVDQHVTVEVYGLSLGEGITYELASETTRTYKPGDPIYTRNIALAPGTENVIRQARTGYVVKTYRLTLKNGAEIGREQIYSSEYKMYDKEVEYN